MQDDLNVQIAQRLFGFTVTTGVHGFTLWKDGAGTVHHAIPAYTTNPMATALVWQWVEKRVAEPMEISYEYLPLRGEVVCTIYTMEHSGMIGASATWPEALCRAALALAATFKEAEAPLRPLPPASTPDAPKGGDDHTR